MGTILGRGNVEMMEKIRTRGGHLLRAMWGARDEKTIVAYRVCSPQEAIDTWFYCLAGGKYVDLVRPQPTEQQAIEQVGNNEGVSRGGKPDPRLLVLEKMGIKPAPPKPRKVVEFSWRPALQFGHNFVRVGLNQDFCVKGSGLSFEGGGGLVVQIGTPLSWVEIDEALQAEAFPTRAEVG